MMTTCFASERLEFWYIQAGLYVVILNYVDLHSSEKWLPVVQGRKCKKWTQNVSSYQEARKVSKTTRIVSTELRSQLKEAPTGPCWTTWASVRMITVWIGTHQLCLNPWVHRISKQTHSMIHFGYCLSNCSKSWWMKWKKIYYLLTVYKMANYLMRGDLSLQRYSANKTKKKDW